MPLFPSVTPLDDAARQAVVDALTPALVDAQALYSVAQHAHWNVRGPYFCPLHKLFGTIRDAFGKHADTLAERITALGGVAPGLPEQIADNGIAPLTTEEQDGLELVGPLFERVKAWAATAAGAMVAADAQGDQVTLTVLTDVSKHVEKLGWMLGAHLPAPSKESDEDAEVE